MDTSTYTHLCRAGHADIIQTLAPGGVVLIPSAVSREIEHGRELYADIPSVSSVGWADIAILTEEEEWTQLGIKAALGGGPYENLGECEVIACCYNRSMIAILDDSAAIEQADILGVRTHDTMWLVIEAHKLHGDRELTVRTVDDLLATGMYLPLNSGESVMAWAYREGLLP